MNPIVLNHFGRKAAFIQMLKERQVKFGVEIGTDHGVYARNLIDGIPGLRLNCIDPWFPYTEGGNIHTQEDMDNIYKEAQSRLNDTGTNVYRMTSMKAVEYFPDNSLDFVFIDGNHSYSYVLEDIREWTEKVKPGGIVAGHDYVENMQCDYGVIEAVNDYTRENHIAPLFILHAGGSFADCFMFFKQ